jgi:hypothetical protein
LTSTQLQSEVRGLILLAIKQNYAERTIKIQFKLFKYQPILEKAFIEIHYDLVSAAHYYFSSVGTVKLFSNSKSMME